MEGGRRFNTRAVHEGEIVDTRYGNVGTPIFEVSTFLYPNEDSSAVIDDTTGKPFLYTRIGNPTLQALERKYASLEGTDRGLSFSSGMNAIFTCLLSVASKGTRILAQSELYGQTRYLLERVLPRYGIQAEFVSVEEMNRPDREFSGYSLVYVESISNPVLGVTDIPEVSRKAREAGALTVVDATFASPYNQNPCSMGADITVHSATKYIGGHSDIILGLAGMGQGLYSRVSDMRKSVGGTPDPIQAFLALRSLKTLGVRVERHNSNAMKVASFLEASGKVKRVFYPGLDSSPYKGIADRVLRGYGGMVSFELKSGLQGARRLLRALKLPMVAPSLGGAESLITLPVDTSHAQFTPEERARMGIPEGLIRFSVGLEDAEDIIEDLQQALDAV
ncbi:methionine gamma-lyase [Thermogymnomonas acidicola]|uniref:Methionine gamma-lyase n=1 Tax=Thermogymnomonas acidicola TaxID=399579 RepID=A0AA37BR06_9ARCH|nr:PLP-dependent transferase [Thermogymnomonas acidicola]GGM68926.1 methionine gamma-lyase [Thermogymnomonas acidicola]